jgi:outer membrane beta-barrel protein
MKKFSVLMIAVMLMAVSAAAQAEVKAGSFSVTPFAGGYVFEGNEGLKDTYTAGFRAGYNFTENIGLEGYFSFTPAEIDDYDSSDVKLYSYGVEGIYHFMPQSRFVPFVAVGIGGIYYETPAGVDYISKFSIDYGAGFKYFITDDVALRADVRHVMPINDTYNDLLFTVGVTFSFGGEKKKVAVAKVEEDFAPRASVPVAKVEAPPVAPKVEEPAPVKEVVAPAPAPAPVPEPAPAPVVASPAVVESAAPVSIAPKETKSTIEDDIRNFVNTWLASWQSGDMTTYRDCYSPDFQSKGMDLDAWIAYKTNVRERSKDISIKIEDLKISADEGNDTVTIKFNQYYNSSIHKDSVRKTLKMKKIGEAWKIYKETIEPLK